MVSTEHLKKILSYKDTVIFVGSGVSRLSGLPSWSGLIQDLIDYLDKIGIDSTLTQKEFDNGDLLQAASFGVDKLSSDQYRDFIFKSLKVETSKPNLLHEKIINLGSKCYITTNFDQLLETAISNIHKEKHYSIITPHKIPEMANIAQASSRSFIFKPHGDIDDIDSLVFTREDYSKVLHEQKDICKTLSILLVSRPFIFIGFGLKDPDYRFISDMIYSDYKGNAIDHYAIMPNISKEEIVYWKKNNGINIISYKTVDTVDLQDKHAGLYKILDELNSDKNEILQDEESSNLNLTSSEFLSLIRYSSWIISNNPQINKKEYPLRLSKIQKNRHGQRVAYSSLHREIPINDYLHSNKENIILLGKPGAGKSYSLKKYVFELATNLRDQCVNENSDFKQLQFPIHIDLKLYEGDISKMVIESLPSNISFEFIKKKLPIVLILDSYNELPKEYIENIHCIENIQSFINKNEIHKTIIASRFGEGLEVFGYEEFELENIDYSYVINELAENDIIINDKFRWEIMNLIRKPIFFKLVLDKKIQLSKEMKYSHLYDSYFSVIEKDLSLKFNVQLDLIDLLSPISYEMISKGLETIKTDFFYKTTKSFTSEQNIQINDEDLLNWLINNDLIIPYPGLRLSFFHQSITEYLASRELAKAYLKNNEIIFEILKETRWDEVIYFTTQFLADDEIDEFILKIIKTDIKLAIRAVSYNEFASDHIISLILETVLSLKHLQAFDLYPIYYLLEKLPVTRQHEEMLLLMLKKGSSIGASAITLLNKIYKGNYVELLIEELFSHVDDYNYCSTIGNLICENIEPKNKQIIVDRLLNYKIFKPEFIETDFDGLIVGFRNMFSNETFENIYSFFHENKGTNYLSQRIYIEILGNIKTSKRIVKQLIEFVLMGNNEAIYQLYSHLNQNNDLLLDSELEFSKELIDCLVSLLNDSNQAMWTLELLKKIHLNFITDKIIVNNHILNSKGVIKLALIYSISSTNYQEFWNYLDILIADDSFHLKKEPIVLFESFNNLEWETHISTLISIIKLNNKQLTLAIVNSIYGFNKDKFEFEFDTSVLSLLLEQMAEDSSVEKQRWFCYRLGWFIAVYSDFKSKERILTIFEKSTNEIKSIISKNILVYFQNISTDTVSNVVIDFLLQELEEPIYPFLESHTIGYLATEKFIINKILPLYETSDGLYKENLYKTIHFVGKKLKKRFLIIQ